MKKVTKDYSLDIYPYLHFKDWTAEKLQNERIHLGLTQKDIGKALGVTPVTISAIETGKTTNVWAIQLYGIVLERYRAYGEGYIPTYRKAGKTIHNPIYGEIAIIKDF